MLFDTHAHLNAPAFGKDLEEVIGRTEKGGILLINVGYNFSSSERALEIGRKHPGFFSAVGLHPNNLDTGLLKIKKKEEDMERDFDFKKYEKLCLSDKVVAIGEIGLDYYWKPKTAQKKELFKQKQKELLSQQLALAKETDLPVIFHCRMAHRDLLEFLRQNRELRPEKAVAHGFVGNAAEMKDYLDMGYYLGLNGIIFKKIEGIDFEKNIRQIPLDRILLETDCPFLSPPGAGQLRNEPVFLNLVAERIAEIKKVDCQNLLQQTCKNARKLFDIP